MFSPYTYLFILLSDLYVSLSAPTVHGVNTCKPSAGKVEARSQGQPHGDFKDSLGHIILCFKEKKYDSFTLP